MEALLSSPSPNRRRLFTLAIAAWAFFAAWFIVLFQPTPAQWPLAALITATGLGALGTAAVVVEVRRTLAPGASAWTDEVHRRRVAFWAAVLFVIKLTGISLAIQT